MMKCIIVEDEPLALEKTKSFVMKLPFLNLLSYFDNAFDALAFLRTNTVDLIFLDINMDSFSGIELLETSAIKSQVIITTAYHEHALKGFDLKVTDYLLKPFTMERFIQAVERASEKLHIPVNSNERKFIFIKTEYRLEKVNLNEILYIEGMRDYRRIHTKTKRIMTLQTFQELEKEIPEDIICRIHKSYMVGLDKIDSIEKERVKIGNILLPVSETYKESLFNLIHHTIKK